MALKNIDRVLKLPLKHSFFLFGPRQVGKTTLIKNSFGLDSCLIYDLLIPEELRRLKMNLGRFRDEIIYRDSKYTHVFIDEVQKLPEILDAILALRSYVNTYIKEEIQMEALVRNLDTFTEFLKLAADENTNVLNYSNIASDIGVSSATVKEYYQILEDTLIHRRTLNLKVLNPLKH